MFKATQMKELRLHKYGLSSRKRRDRSSPPTFRRNPFFSGALWKRHCFHGYFPTPHGAVEVLTAEGLGGKPLKAHQFFLSKSRLEKEIISCQALCSIVQIRIEYLLQSYSETESTYQFFLKKSHLLTW